MTGAIEHDTARQLRAALGDVLDRTPDLSSAVVAAFGRLLDVLESSDDAVVLAADAKVSTQEAATLLGVSRMTVVRLIDSGELDAERTGVHRRIPVAEVARYRETSAARRRAAVAELAGDIDSGTPPDVIVATR